MFPYLRMAFAFEPAVVGRDVNVDGAGTHLGRFFGALGGGATTGADTPCPVDPARRLWPAPFPSLADEQGQRAPGDDSRSATTAMLLMAFIGARHPFAQPRPHQYAQRECLSTMPLGCVQAAPPGTAPDGLGSAPGLNQDADIRGAPVGSNGAQRPDVNVVKLEVSVWW